MKVQRQANKYLLLVLVLVMEGLVGACAPLSNTEIQMPEVMIEEEKELGLGGGMEETGQASLAGLILPHHELAHELISSAWELALEKEVDLIVLVGPDHPGLSDHPLIWTEKIATSQVWSCAPEAELWLEKGLGGPAIAADHSIETPLEFLSEEFRHIPVLALTVPGGLESEQIDGLVEAIMTLKGNCMLVGSVDFSHDLTSQASQVMDEESLEWILTRDYARIRDAGNDHFDSPETIEILLRSCSGEIELIDRSDSSEFGWSKELPGTSYQVIGMKP